MERFDRQRGGRRGLRVASVIREVVSEALVFELDDPRKGLVTVTGVKVSADLRLADVNVSILGEPAVQNACMDAIRRRRVLLQERVAEALTMKFCPVLRFHLDPSVKRSVQISALIRRARAEDEAARAERIRRGVEPPDAEPSTDEATEPTAPGTDAPEAEKGATAPPSVPPADAEPPPGPPAPGRDADADPTG